MDLITIPVLAQATWGWCHTPGWSGGLWHLAFWTAVGGLLVWLVIAATRGRTDPRHDVRATLDERLARGELSPEEYREHREALR